MATHTNHPDTHEFGLADGCPRCDQQAEDPIVGLDTRNLMAVVERISLDLVGRSNNESQAMSQIRRVMVRVERLEQLQAMVGEEDDAN